MKKLFLKIALISSVFSSVPLSGMSCTLKLIKATVNQILIEIDNLSIVNTLSVVDVEINEIALQISDLGAVISTQLAEISSDIELLSSVSSVELLCLPISMPTTITQAGAYCLISDIAGTITINASNVALDLNGYEVTMGITITAEQDTVSITNGTVLGGSPGILVQTGCTNISITNVLVKNGTSGILFEQVNGGLVEHCTLTNNMTGLALINSNRINVVNTVATANTYAGFDLLTSSTNSFVECKALATGQGNTATSNNFVVGFSSANGYGNIFERCIANGTQAPLTTDSKSLVAGFALRISESASKIIGCESANASASGSGVTVPHGILCEYNTNNLLASIAQGDVNVQRQFAQWSPDGNYILTTGLSNTEIYQFDGVMNSLTLIATTPLDASSNSAQGAWSPSGNYFAIGSRNNTNNVGKVTIYSFDQNNSSINGVVTVAPNYGINGVAWSPDEQFIVFTYNITLSNGDGYLELYQFNAVQGTLTFCYSVNEPRPDGFFLVDWSADGNYIAVANLYRAQVYTFNRASKTITFLSQDLSVNDVLTSCVSWSPDGNYIASAGLTNVQIYSFTNSVLKLVQTVASNLTETSLDIHWSPDGNYLVINGSQNSPNTIARVYFYNHSLNTLNLVAESTAAASSVYQSSGWSPDGQYIVIQESSGALAIVKGLAFPSNNVITDNTVYCNGQTMSASLTWGTLIGATGVGISGSSIGNMIIGNTAYNNPPVSTNTFVPSNYQFVPNIFNPLFGQAPSALQNISLNANDPTTAPEDIGLLMQQIVYNVTVPLPSQLEAIEATLISAIDNISLLESPCSPTAITTGTTITAAGNYCVANSLNGNIVINVSDVNLDLNNRTVAGTITIAATMSSVTISNGTINANGGASGILVNPGASGITISNVTIKNAVTGIDFMSAYDATVQGCTLTQNTTGLQLNSSYNINVSDTVALSNTHAGFDLISSFTTSFINCKALATGQNNSVIYNNEVVGFSSLNGYGNIFERCIANGTQAFSTTDLSSLIAGFALRGTESCSKIIGCESSNANASESGVTVPYGILLQGTLSSISAVTGASTNELDTVVWSPDGQYVAIIGSTTHLQILQFNRTNNMLTVVVQGTVFSADNMTGPVLAWSPDGQYLAVLTSTLLEVYSFDRINNRLTLQRTVSGTSFYCVDWSYDGQYLAVAAAVAGNAFLQIYRFDSVANALTLAESLLTARLNLYVTNWSADGQYIATGGGAASSSEGFIEIFFFNRSNSSLTSVASFDTPSGNDSVVSGLSWSPDNQYIAVVGTYLATPSNISVNLLVLKFNRSTQTLSFLIGFLLNSFNPTMQSVSWSPDGKYIVVGGPEGDGDVGGGPSYNFEIFEFDMSSNSLTRLFHGFPYSSNNNMINSVDWSPDGQYIALGGLSITSGLGTNFQILTGLNFPSQNVITDNTIYCNGHDVSHPFTGAVGVGISGTSICNMIIGNTAYNNPPTTSNFFVPSNYQFVTNVFNPLYGQAPTELQNISLNACDPIVAPVDVGLLAQQILYNVEGPIPSQLDVILAAVSLCKPTAITTGTTITAAGNYCVANSLNGNIVINTGDVNLDLNNRTVTGTITVTAAMSGVSISNGTINANGGASGILVNPGALNVTISNVTVTNATTGIDFMSAYDATIAGCTLTQNIIGLQLNSSYNVQVSDTIASSNVNAGFDLISSFTTSFINCKALSTGQNNAVIYNNEVAGFSSYNGYGNIFERCIANGTQALSTTDSSSLVAGFVLRGTESCSKIIGCESANANASNAGVTVPYGILLQGMLDGTFNVTGVLSLNYPYDQVESVDWSPDGQYVAVGGFGIGYQFQIFEFNRSYNTLTPVAGALSEVSDDNVNSVKWSPDGQYIAIGGYQITDGYPGNNQFQIFAFDTSNNNLTPVAGALSDVNQHVNSVNWSPDGQYVAIGGSNIRNGYPGNNQFQIFEFNRVTNVLTSIQGALSDVSDDVVLSVNWSPDGQYVAIGGQNITDGYQDAGYQFQIFEFNRSNNNLTPVAGALSDVSDDSVNSVNWSPDGQYVAVGGDGITDGYPGNNQFQIFEFDRSNNNLTPVAGALSDVGDDSVNSVKWSPDGQYIAIGGGDITDGYQDVGYQFQIFEFDRSTNNLTPVAGSLSDTFDDSVNSVNWSPDGQYIAIGGENITENSMNQLQIFTGIQFPSQNVITDNTVYCNGHDVSATFTGAVGVGISGTSICNMIIGNTAYNNPPTTSNFFVPSNYYFVTNVFNPLYGQAPTELQNISLNACDPIVAPVDVGLLAQQILYNVGVSIPLQLDVILAAVSPCKPIGITTGTTITAAGNYCVANSLNGTIVINTSDVYLDLNNRTITGSITIAAAMSSVTISNGTINANGAASGILINPGASGITISNVTIKNAITGIDFMSAYDATIQGCTLTQNTTGLQLNSSYNINVSDTVASSNTHAGFDLISSFTTSFINCKALATGQNNSVIYNNEVVGFSSLNGYGNIFERCIANGTQAFSTTDSSSLIAGFALRGTESCSKVIGCESSNATASASGVTVPYGILLQGTLSSISAVTGASTNELDTVVWSPDGQYVAIIGTTTHLQILQFNRTNSMLTVVAQGTVFSMANMTGPVLAWSPDGQYLAVLTSSPLEIYSFDRINNRLTLQRTVSGTFYCVDWSYDGQYLAVAAAVGVNAFLQIYRFDSVANALTLAESLLTARLNLYVTNWSADGQYIATGGGAASSSEGFIEIFFFNRSNSSLTSVASFDTPSGNDSVVSGLSWSPDNQYIAVVGTYLATPSNISVNLLVLKFNRSTQTLSFLIGFLLNSFNPTMQSVSWSPDGKYIVVGGPEGDGDVGGGPSYNFEIFEFDMSSNSLTRLFHGFPYSSNNNMINSVDWSPDGQYIALGGLSITSGLGTNFQILTGLNFPSQNVITDNTIYCNGHDVSHPFTGAVGVGISGTSICNMIIGNTAYNNPPTTSNFFVPSNYQFVTNVFNPLYGQAPTELQNISLNACDPIEAPLDVGLLILQEQLLMRSVIEILMTKI